MAVTRQPCVYILASQRNGTLYVGVTNDVVSRVRQHRSKSARGFTAKYGIWTLVYLEQHDDMNSATILEKQLKKWNRVWKLRLIEEQNPEWRDLWNELR